MSSLTLRLRRHALATAMMILVLSGTAGIYAPGLSGGFIFDDFPNIVAHDAFRALHEGRGSLWEAATSMKAGPTRRPLSMLSFAAQISETGFDPRAFKIVNLSFHLINGLLLFLLTRILATRITRSQGGRWIGGPTGLALLVTAAWLLAPVNLTGVLYVVQRMESLSTLFTLAALLGYVAGRELMLQGSARGLALCWIALALGTVLGLLAKESAALTPLYALLIETIVYGFRSGGSTRGRHGLVTLYLLLLVIPGLAGLAWILPGVLGSANYGGSRGFSLDERLLTEARVLWTYIGWILLPRLQAMGFYHDDYVISHGWLDPWTTLPAVVGLSALLGAAVLLRKRAPLAALGLGLFFSAHLLTATVIPLELVFEHRNYFASAGLLLALMALVLRAGLVMVFARVAFVGAFIALSAALTSIRAATWGDPILLAMTTASQHPGSPRANYELAHALLLFTEDPQGPLFSLGMQALKQAAALPRSGLLPAQGAIFFSSRLGVEPDERWWVMLRERVRGPVSEEDLNALYTLVECRIEQICRFDTGKLGEILETAVAAHPANPALVTYYANYAANLAHDLSLAHRLMQRAVALAPGKLAYWANLAELQIFTGQRREAAYSLQRMRELSRYVPEPIRMRALRAAFAETFGTPWHDPYHQP